MIPTVQVYSIQSHAVADRARRSHRPQSGVSLVEVLVALLVVSLGMLAMVGLLGTAARFGKTSELRSSATLLAQDKAQHPVWRMAHPSIEHYVPLLYALGASTETDKISFPFQGFEEASLSMRSVRFG